jgi:hypothetical protein
MPAKVNKSQRSRFGDKCVVIKGFQNLRLYHWHLHTDANTPPVPFTGLSRWGAD